jgi:hypothetical protein
MIRKLSLVVVLFWGGVGLIALADGRHSSGRPLPKMPEINRPILFNSPQADRILTALQVFPADNPWNTDVSKWPLHPNSKNIIASIGADKPFRYNTDMRFILVPPVKRKSGSTSRPTPTNRTRGHSQYPTICPLKVGRLTTNTRRRCAA